MIGGGAAGLAAALQLGRARRAVVVIDGGEPRNAPAAHVHGYLGHEGIAPAELLAKGRDEVRRYGVEVVDDGVTEVTRGDGGAFRAQLAGGQAVVARRVLVATGLVDVLPDIDGVVEQWGRGVIHCPYCHGWEVRDQALGVIASNAFAVHQALMFRQWSDDVTLLLNGRPHPSDEESEQLAARGISVVGEPLDRVIVVNDRVTGVLLASGAVVARQALVVSPRMTARSDVLTSLGVETVEVEMNGVVFGSVARSEPTGATSVPGVWVAGNVADLRAQVISSAAAGLNVAAMLNADLIAEDTSEAVAARRRLLATPQPAGR